LCKKERKKACIDFLHPPRSACSKKRVRKYPEILYRYTHPNNMKKAKPILALVACGLLMSGGFSQVAATPISGSISFFGSATASGSSSAGSTTIDFGTNWDFLTGTGIYTSILFLTPATFTDFSFTGDGLAAALGGPIAPLWSLTYSGNTYTFDLLALTSAHVDAGSMAFTGNGLLHATGYDNTAASFGLTGSGNNYVFTLSFTTDAATVPEPSSAALVGVGLALSAAAIYYRRRRRQTA
jgi:hypothetical protein